MSKPKIKEYIAAEKLLRVADVPVDAVACRSAGISQITLIRWRKKVARLSFDAPILSMVDCDGNDPIYIKANCPKCLGNIAKAPMEFDGDQHVYDIYALQCVFCDAYIHKKSFWAKVFGW